MDSFTGALLGGTGPSEGIPGVVRAMGCCPGAPQAATADEVPAGLPDGCERNLCAPGAVLGVLAAGCAVAEGVEVMVPLGYDTKFPSGVFFLLFYVLPRRLPTCTM